MKFLKKLKMSAAMAALLAAGNANAALTVSTSTVGDGSLFLTAFDNVLNVGYIRDLGTTLQGFLNQISWDPRTGDLVATTGSYTFGGDQLFVDTFAASLPTNIQYNISAHDASNTNGGTIGSGTTPHSQRFLSTEQLGSSLIGNDINVVNSQINNITAVKQLAFANAANSGCGFVGNSCATNNTEIAAAYNPGRAASWGDDFGTNLTVDNTQVLGTPLEFFYFTHSGAGPTAQSLKFAVADAVGSRGYWNLAANGTATFVVPVPAAVWLMGSALAGIATVSRRRQAAA